MTEMNSFVVCLAAAVHDVDHPGNNNVFEIKTYSSLATLYNGMQ
jgi:hypothetical protein